MRAMLLSIAPIRTPRRTGQFLQGRTYRGLEQKLGEHPPSILEQGRSGVAKGYGELDNRPGTDDLDI